MRQEALHSVLAATVAALAVAILVAPVRAREESPGTVSLTAADCRRIIRQHPSADAGYRPGVDVHGRSVVPADVDGGGGVQKEFTLPLTVDLFDAYGIAPPLPGADGRIGIGTLAFRGNRVWFNGRPLNGTDADGFVALCRDNYPALR